jgi:hypothetical protein
MKKKYQITKKQCQEGIRGVCEGCGRKLSPIETVDNTGNPTFWIGCKHCGCFRGGVEERYFKIARTLVEKEDLFPYSHMRKSEYTTDKQLDYFYDTQTACLSLLMPKIEELFESYT